MSATNLRRAIASDLQQRFPTPTADQRQVITAVLGSLAAAERQESHADSSNLSMDFRTDSRRLEDRVPQTVDQVLESLRCIGWTLHD
ncbi:MAG: hypothetical protein LH702_02445 [Phormidesmis sp. CAN_BIN44]|nr:hypothetical protein [Phormidesmis sp. CAN_BIN44]